MEMIDNLINGFVDNLPTYIAAAISALTIIGGIVTIVRKAKEIFGWGKKIVNTVVNAFTNMTQNLANSITDLFTSNFNSMRKEFNEQLQVVHNDIQKLMEINALVILGKAVPPSVKTEIITKANELKNTNLKQYVVDLTKSEKPLTETIKLAEVKEVKPTVDKTNKNNKVETYIPTSE